MVVIKKIKSSKSGKSQVDPAADMPQSDDEVEKIDDEESDDSESEEEEDVTAVFKGANMARDATDEGDDSENSGDGDEQDEGVARRDTQPVTSRGDGEQCTFDLRNLLAVNTHQISTASLYKKSNQAEEDITIPMDKEHGLDVDEEYLLARASEGCAQLVHALWQLPTERSDAGPMVNLPSYDEIPIPRALVGYPSMYIFLTFVAYSFLTVCTLVSTFEKASSATKTRD
jgi:hypothetical protein